MIIPVFWAMEHVRLSTDVPVGYYHKVHGLSRPGTSLGFIPQVLTVYPRPFDNVLTGHRYLLDHRFAGALRAHRSLGIGHRGFGGS